MIPRTLKDFCRFRTINRVLDKSFEEGYKVCKEDFREEAVHWIKLLKCHEGEFGPIIPIKREAEISAKGDCDGVEISRESISFIKHFFNITAEDLK